MEISIENNQQLALTEVQLPNKRRKKKSIVWEHFTIETVSPECRRACCNQCKQTFAYSTGSKVAGTSHLKRHISKGTCPRNQAKNQLAQFSTPSASHPRRKYRTAASLASLFDPIRCRHEIARMMIMHDYPLHMVEHPGFISFVQTLQPQFEMVSFNIVQGDCVATFLREKQNLMRLVEAIPGKISLALDLWTCTRSLGYVFLTGHFIDGDWKLHRWILNVVMEPYPDSEAAFSHAVAVCLTEWSLENKLFSVTLNRPLGEVGSENLRAHLSIKNPLMLKGQFLIANCLARTLSSMAQDVLCAGHASIDKIRDSVKYVKSSDSHEEKFLELKQHLQVPSKKALVLDNHTQWNTTYEMLVAASELKEVFSCLDTSDHGYKDAPTMDHWKAVETLTFFLKMLFDAATVVASPDPTANLFFHEVFRIQLELARGVVSDDDFISDFSGPMLETFDKYWKDCSLVLAIAVVMDPRYKMKLVEFSFTKMYGDDAAANVKIIEEGINELFLEYVSAFAVTYGEDRREDGEVVSGEGLTDFDVYIIETTSQHMKSELEQYLEDSLHPRSYDFDVLGWWKVNRVKYPTLSHMARDILAVPVSTVPAESVFDTGSREMDEYRCGLRPETVEALICAKDWLRHGTNWTLAPVKMECF